MKTQVLIPQKQLHLVDSNKEVVLDLLLPNTNEIHYVKVITNNFECKNNELVELPSKIPIIVTVLPSNKYKEFKCKRWFVSKLIQRIRNYLVQEYGYYFNIKTVRQIDLNITTTIDSLNTSTLTFSLKLYVRYVRASDNKIFHEVFNFSTVSLAGDIVLESSSTLPPNNWEVLRHYLVVPRSTIYKFNDKLVNFEFKGKNYQFNLLDNTFSW